MNSNRSSVKQDNRGVRPIRPVWRALRFVALIYGGFVLLVAAFQRTLIYYPEIVEPERLNTRAKQLGYEPWIDTDGDYAGWRIDTGNGNGALIVFHGNAGYALMRDYWVGTFSRLGEAGFRRIYLFEYPGYGKRPGRPSEQAFLLAAEQAVEAALLESKEELDLQSVVFLGESIGSGPASAMAAKFSSKTAGLLLITPFTRLSDVGRAHFPFLPVRWMLRDRFDNAAYLKDFHAPVAILIAGRDEVVPASLGRELHEGLGYRSRLWELSNANHNSLLNFASDALWLEMLKHIRERNEMQRAPTFNAD